MKRFLEIASGCWLFVFTSVAAGIPSTVLPEGVGVNIHFVEGHGRDLDLIAAAGFKFVRMDFGWEAIEQKKGEYRWTHYEELTRDLEARHLRPIYILDYSNRLYEQEVESKNPISGAAQRDLASPQHPASVEGYARWAAAASRHFHGRGVIWEIWNEPNISFWKPQPNASQYTALALAAAHAIRQADPEATIMGPASSGLPWPFLERFLASGILEYLDGVSVHPYRNYSNPPESAAGDYARLRQLIEVYGKTPSQKNVPIISGEWGYATHTRGVNLEQQAEFAVRQQLSNLIEGVPLSIWYDWKNDGPDPAEREHNFGVVDLELRPKPAYEAIQTMTRQLGGYEYAGLLPASSEEDTAAVFAKENGERKLVYWTRGKPHAQLLLAAKSEALPEQAISMLGKSIPLARNGDGVTLAFSGGPQYFVLRPGQYHFAK